MKKFDLRVLTYLSIMFLIVSCVAIIYGLVFFNQPLNTKTVNISYLPQIIITLGVVMAAANSIAANLVSDILSQSLGHTLRRTRVVLSISVFLITLGAGIVLALMSSR